MVGQLAESAGVATLIENGELTLENGEHLSLSAGSAVVMEICDASALSPRLLYSGGVVMFAPAGREVLDAEVGQCKLECLKPLLNMPGVCARD
jgi:hypothetical protein